MEAPKNICKNCIVDCPESYREPTNDTCKNRKPLLTDELKDALYALNYFLEVGGYEAYKTPVVKRQKEIAECLLPENCCLEYCMRSRKYYVCHRKLGRISIFM